MILTTAPRRRSPLRLLLATAGASTLLAAAPAAHAAEPLEWSPPDIPDATTIQLSAANSKLTLEANRDYRLVMPARPLQVSGGLSITGGRHVVLIGGEIALPATTSTDVRQRRAIYLKGQTGTVHIEGVRMSGDLADGVIIEAPHATVQLENLQIDAATTRDRTAYKDAPDLVQSWAGPAVLRVDGLQGTTEYRGITYDPNANGMLTSPKELSLRRVAIDGRTSPVPLLWLGRRCNPSVDCKALQLPRASVSDVWARPNPARVRPTEVVWQEPAPWDPRTEKWARSLPLEQSVWAPVRFGEAPASVLGAGWAPGVSYTSPGYRAPSADGTPASAATRSAKLRWAPPELTNPTVVKLVPGNFNPQLTPGRDYILKLPEDAPLNAPGGVTITGGRNVVLIGGEIHVPYNPAANGEARRGLYLRAQTGTVHVEGVRLTGDLGDGITLSEPHAYVQIQNVYVDQISARDRVGYTDTHPDLIQSWAGPMRLRVDRFTGTTDYQGFFLDANQTAMLTSPEELSLSRVDLHARNGGSYMLWLGRRCHADIDCPSVALPEAWLDDVWVEPNPLRSLSALVFWQDPVPFNPTNQSQAPTEHADTTVWAPAHIGVPAGGSFVDRSAVGPGYVSPGYEGGATSTPAPAREPVVREAPPVAALAVNLETMKAGGWLDLNAAASTGTRLGWYEFDDGTGVWHDNLKGSRWGFRTSRPGVIRVRVRVTDPYGRQSIAERTVTVL
jgi:hypothetical protein